MSGMVEVTLEMLVRACGWPRAMDVVDLAEEAGGFTREVLEQLSVEEVLRLEHEVRVAS